MRMDNLSKVELENELAQISRLLRFSLSDDRFCLSHELVANTRITRRKKKILKARRQLELKPFYFLVNLN